MAKTRVSQRTTNRSETPITGQRVQSSPRKEVVMPFERMNYILLAAGIAIIALGFFLMSIGDFKDAAEFSIALHVAPVVVVAGFIEVIYAIMYAPKKEEAETPTETAAE